MKTRSKQPKAGIAASFEGDGTMRRAEQLVHYLKSCYVCDGWKFDEAAAETFLENVRRTMDRPNYSKPFYAANEWIVRHGQSLDWVWRGDPGGMICGLAAASVKPVRRAA